MSLVSFVNLEGAYRGAILSMLILWCDSERDDGNASFSPSRSLAIYLREFRLLVNCSTGKQLQQQVSNSDNRGDLLIHETISGAEIVYHQQYCPTSRLDIEFERP